MTTKSELRLVERAPPPSAAPPHVDFLGLRFATLSQSEAVRLILESCGTGNGRYRYVVTPNAHHVVVVQDALAILLPVYREAWLSLCDSRILRALARWDGRDLPLVTGSDLTAALLAVLNATQRPGGAPRLLIVGPPPGTAEQLRSVFADLQFDVLPAPNGLARDEGLRAALARACAERPWDILLLCVGCPAQELVAAEIARLGRRNGIALCVGAAIDFLIGKRTRAPLWVQKLSLEWAYRLVSEPGRLWRRYLVESPRVLRIFMADRAAQKRP